jgi:ABC-2 type transport system permease protein
MSAFFHLWRRENGACFRTSIAYVIGAFFLLLTGFGFWMRLSQLSRGVLDGDLPSSFFGSPGFWLVLMIVTPLLTMRLFAEERRMGTLESLMTAPVTETEVVLAKFASAYSIFLLLWVPTLAYAAILKQCGAQLPPIDLGSVAAGYLGTALLGAFFLATGLLCSLLTRHQIVAAMASLATMGLLLSAGLLPFHARAEAVGSVASLFSAQVHMGDFAAGVLDTRAIVWYVSATVLVLFSSIRILEARRLR